MRRLIAAGAFVLIAVGATIGWYAWQHRSPSLPTARGMASATVVSTTPAAGGKVEVTATYDVGGRHTVTGSVDRTNFEQGGRVVWVCYPPKAAGDTGKAWIRVPGDRLCGQS